MKFCSFDIEIAKEIPEGESWEDYRPFGISCAATICTREVSPILWFEGDLSNPGPQMTKGALRKMVEYLSERLDSGYVPLTWNGLSFDFHVLAEESGMWKECADLALHHVDMMFQIVCLRGHRLGLDKALRGMGLTGKPEGMHGGLAPTLWKQGEYQKVLDYVANDVIQPLQLAELVERRGELAWVSNSGNAANVVIDRWLTVRECLELPLPDTSWMSYSESRQRYLAWMKETPGTSFE